MGRRGRGDRLTAAGDRLEVVRSGGFAGITLRTSVDAGTLSPEEVAPIERLLEEAGTPPAGPAPRSRGVDRFHYEVTLTGEAGERKVSLTETELAPELRRLLDELLTRGLGRPSP